MNWLNWPAVIANLIGIICFLAFIFFGFTHYIRHIIVKQKLPILKRMNSAKLLRLGSTFINTWGVVCFGILILFMVSHLDKMKSIVDLSPQEIFEISQESQRIERLGNEKWQVATSDTILSLSNNYESTLEQLVETGVVFLIHENPEFDLQSILNPVHVNGLTARREQKQNAKFSSQWMTYFDSHGIETRFCYWEKIEECSFKQSLVVLPPGNWKQEWLERIWQRGLSLWMIGYPRSLTTGDVKKWSWKGLVLSRSKFKYYKKFMLKADQELTLGLDAGNLIDAESLFSDFQATALRSQAFRTHSENPLAHAFSTALYAKTSRRIKGGRLVWIDFRLAPPQRLARDPKVTGQKLLGLEKNILRYLLKQKYSAVATWPAGKAFAGFMAQDTEDGYANTQKVVDLVKEHNFPVTWFLLSDLALKNRDLTRQMAEVGEMACHGDSHDDFAPLSLRMQTLRLARCQKVILRLTGEKAVGFRPPREIFDFNLFNAFATDQVEVGFIGHQWHRMTPQWLSQGSKNILVIPRFGKDDFNLWEDAVLADGIGYGVSQSVNDGSQEAPSPLEMAKFEINQVHHLGGLYSYSFHSQFMHLPEQLNVVKVIGLELQQRKAFFANVKQLAHWWLIRKKINSGVKIDQIWLEKYLPVVIAVDARGFVSRGSMTNRNNPNLYRTKPRKAKKLLLVKFKPKKPKFRYDLIKPRLEIHYNQ